jgi:DNA segregation ATPase FtsK/SpoIIIE-like protein
LSRGKTLKKTRSKQISSRKANKGSKWVTLLATAFMSEPLIKGAAVLLYGVSVLMLLSLLPIGKGELLLRISSWMDPTFGIAKWLLPFLLGFIAFYIFRIEIKESVRAIIACLCGLLSSCLLLSAGTGMYGLGGSVGNTLTATLEPNLGIIATVVVGITGLGFAMVVAPFPVSAIFSEFYDVIKGRNVLGEAVKSLAEQDVGTVSKNQDRTKKSVGDNSSAENSNEVASSDLIEHMEIPIPVADEKSAESSEVTTREGIHGNHHDWILPPLSLLDSVKVRRERLQDEIKKNAGIIERTLQSFGVQAKVIGVNPGPTVTQYEVQPATGVPVKRITALSNDLALALAAAPIRIEAPIPGKSAVGIEVPNKTASIVSLKEILQSPHFVPGPDKLLIALGNDVAGHPVVTDLTRMPHLLIAGATGSGKSVCLNVMIASLLLQATPFELRMLLIDPKRVELSSLNGIPHLLVPVIVEPEKAVGALKWATVELERRYKIFAEKGVRNIQAYNAAARQDGFEPMPYICIVIDELADLMMIAAGDIEELICRIAQLARAVGMHLVVATQRPSTDIITGLIKANIPSRIAFAVSSQVDSRVILDTGGAEKLLGRGDMLYLPVDAGKPIRIQGAYISDHEINALVKFWKEQGGPIYEESVLDDTLQLNLNVQQYERKLDPLFGRAARLVAAEGVASVSLLQRKFNIGYSRAGRLIDQLAEYRVIGPYQGSRAREVLMGLSDVDILLQRLGLEE